MPYSDNHGVKVYYEVEGEGPPLAMVLGLGNSLEEWRSVGVVGDLKHDYQLIMIDARGNGRSAKPHDPAAYTLAAMVGDVLAVLDTLGIEQANYWGYSMGASLGYGALSFAPHRFRSLILGGSSPYGITTEAGRQQVDVMVRSMAMAVEMGMEAYAAVFEQNFGPMAPDERARFVANDPRAMLAHLHGAGRWEPLPWPPVDDFLPSVTTPCLIYLAEFDPLFPSSREAAARLPNARFLLVPGAHHFNIQWSQVKSVVQQFLAEVNAG